MYRILYAMLVCALLLSTRNSASGQESNALPTNDLKSVVRTTEALSADDERQRLNVPEGFRIKLFASEPQIQKPMNMAFDADGRLWVTGSNAYPEPAETGKGGDTVRVLQDTTGDGRADQVTTFADNLNIPMGLYPWQNGVIVFSIPDILFLRDTDGDGKADQRDVLYGPFDTTRDTHGMNNAFRRGFDGWLYCCHGFNNQSQVVGTDGHAVTMHSGNTYRIRLDGSRIEHFTHGQVNPFGMVVDANGDLFNSDCHTKPVSLLLRGGYYESFGKPDDGLGFVPDVMKHLHGSTAIDALCQYQATAFPKEYHDDLFVGNVMTCRIHRNSIVRNGASIALQQEQDFLVSEDPWFRPVDMQIGPDGALYIADFYNRIIGHYEVPLDHPGRDRSRGRIWRVDWVGPLDESQIPVSNSSAQLSSADLDTLITVLGDKRKGVRQHATDQIVDRIGPAAADALQTALNRTLATTDQIAVPHLLWALQRIHQLPIDSLEDAFTRGSVQTRIHAMRICSERDDGDKLAGLIRRGLRDSERLVNRSAADAAAQHPLISLAKEVINATVVSPEADIHLQHALKIALRDQFQSPAVATWFTGSPAPQVALDAVTKILPGVKGSQAAELGLFLLQAADTKQRRLAEIVRIIAASATDQQFATLLRRVASLSGGDITADAEVWEAIQGARRGREGANPPSFARWGAALSDRILKTVDPDDLAWGQYSLSGEPSVTWALEDRRSRDNPSDAPFLSSLPGGERGVGVIRSRPFVLPFEIRSRVCGHLGPPTESPMPMNRLVLRDADSGVEIKTILAPRNDVASVIDWKLGGYAGRRGYFELIDGMDRSAYAWIAIGRPTPAVVKPEEFDNGQQADQLAAAIRILIAQQANRPKLRRDQIERLKKIMESVQVGGMARSLAAESLLLHFDQSAILAIADLLQLAATPYDVEQAIIGYCEGPQDATEGYSREIQQGLIKGIFRRINRRLRERLVNGLADSSSGAEVLLAALKQGTPSTEVLRDERLVERLLAHGGEIAQAVRRMKTDLPPAAQSHHELAESVLTRLRLSEGNPALGEATYRKHCAACHRRSGEGGQAGPQLDGIATRGAARLLEDILQPNQNVDINFRTSTLVLKNGKVMSGIVRKTDPLSVLLSVVGTDGKSTAVSGDDVDQRVDSRVSLMPANVSTLLTEDELLNLVAWLMK